MSAANITVRCKCQHVFYEGAPGVVSVPGLVAAVAAHRPTCSALEVEPNE